MKLDKRYRHKDLTTLIKRAAAHKASDAVRAARAKK
jgi:hypothetical protein